MNPQTELVLIVADVLGSTSFLGSDNNLYKKIDGHWIGKSSVQCVNSDKTTFSEWFEVADKSKIDLRYYNLDGTKK